MVVKILGAVEKKSIIDDKRAAGCPKRYYRNGAIEIVYMHNTADRITITNTDNKPLEEFINLYGLKELSGPLFFVQIAKRKTYSNQGSVALLLSYPKGVVNLI
ncbi:hypothetical protein [Rhodocytophaga aerolata]|uniref:hypothetical protein n=1 Tax=Rhodocytophaga aerolata TaxID=455078 RepID=UPI00366B8976